MRAPVVLVLLCVLLAVHGQESYRSEPVRKGWMLGIGVSPEMAFRTLKGDGSPYASDIIARRNAVEQPRWAYTAGLYANYFFNERIGVGTGLAYSLKGYDLTKHWVDELAWHAVPFIPHHIEGTIGAEYLDVPVIALVVLGKGRLRSITSIGVVGNFFVANRARYSVEYADGRTFHHYDRGMNVFESAELSGLIGCGVSYRAKQRLELRLEPNFRHAILTSGIPFVHTSLHWSAGINVSAFLDLR